MRVRVFVCIVVLLLLLRRHVMQASLQAGLSSMRRCSSCNAAPVGVMPKYGTLGQTGSSDTLLVMRMYGSCNLVL